MDAGLELIMLSDQPATGAQHVQASEHRVPMLLVTSLHTHHTARSAGLPQLAMQNNWQCYNTAGNVRLSKQDG
jgi:hypothetical protein